MRNKKLFSHFFALQHIADYNYLASGIKSNEEWRVIS